MTKTDYHKAVKYCPKCKKFVKYEDSDFCPECGTYFEPKEVKSKHPQTLQ